MRVQEQMITSKNFAYLRNRTTGTNGIISTHPLLEIWVFSFTYKVLVAHVVSVLVDHEAATLHPNGVALAEVGVQVGAVFAALIVATTKVLVFKENDLKLKKKHKTKITCCYQK